MFGTLGNMSYRKPTQPGLNKTERSLLTLITECLQVNSMAGSGCSDIIRAHFFPLSSWRLFRDSVFLSGGSLNGGEVLAAADTHCT